MDDISERTIIRMQNDSTHVDCLISEASKGRQYEDAPH